MSSLPSFTGVDFARTHTARSPQPSKTEMVRTKPFSGFSVLLTQHLFADAALRLLQRRGFPTGGHSKRIKLVKLKLTFRCGIGGQTRRGTFPPFARVAIADARSPCRANASVITPTLLAFRFA